MASPATTDELLQLVRKSRLLEDGQLSDYIHRSETPLPGSTKSLAAAFVRDGLLTSFQAEQLLHGKYRGFELGKYKVLDRIGCGGMGQVFLAEHTLMKRRVALKVLPPKQAADPAARERFLREARAAGALAHPNIVRAYDIDSHHGIHFLVIEYVDGASLQDIVDRFGPLSPARAGFYLWQAAIGLQHAHEAGLVHRDVKPANLLLDRSGVVKVLDMGLALFFADKASSGESGKDVLGTADYLAPEQGIDSREVDARTDLYSLGATGFFMLAGKAPFAGGTTSQILLAHQMKEPPPLTQFRSDVPADLAAVIARLMRKEPDARIQSAAEVVEALNRWSDHPPAPPTAEQMPNPGLSGQAASKPGSWPRIGVKSTLLAGARSAGRGSKGWPTSKPAKQDVPQHRRTGAAMLAATLLLGGVGGVWWTGLFASRQSEDLGPIATAAAPPPAEKTPAHAAVLPASASEPKKSEVATKPAERESLAGLQRAKVTSATPNPGVGTLTPAPPKPLRTLIVGNDPKPGAFSTIQAALDQARPGDWVVVRLPIVREVVRITGASPAGKKITLVGQQADGQAVMWVAPSLHPAVTPILDLAGVENVSVRGFLFDGEKRVETLVGVTGECPGLELDKVQFRQFTHAAIRLADACGTPAQPIAVRNCRVYSPAAFASSGVVMAAATGRQTRHVAVTDNRVEGPCAAAARIAGSASEVSFERNRILQTTDGILVEKTIPLPVVQTTIRNNTFGETQAGVRVQAEPDSASAVVIQKNLFLTGQLVRFDGRQPVAPRTSALMIWSDDAKDPLRYAPVGPRYFRKSFVADPSAVTAAQLDIACDNEFTAWLNGQLLGRSATSSFHKRVLTFDLTPHLAPGTNVLAVHAVNAGPDTPINPAWLAARVVTMGPHGTPNEITSDGTWCATTVEMPQWQARDFDDSGWGRARELTQFARSGGADFLWEKEAQTLGGLPAQLFPRSSGNVREARATFDTAFLTAVGVHGFTLSTVPADDKNFLRYPQDHTLATQFGRPGAP